MGRKVVDCSQVSSSSSCTLRISGEEQEVLRMAVLHAVDAHGHRDTPELRERIRGMLREELPGDE